MAFTSMPCEFFSVASSIGLPSNFAVVVVFVTELPTRTAKASSAAVRARVNMRGIVNDYAGSH